MSKNKILLSALALVVMSVVGFTTYNRMTMIDKNQLLFSNIEALAVDESSDQWYSNFVLLPYWHQMYWSTYEMQQQLEKPRYMWYGGGDWYFMECCANGTDADWCNFSGELYFCYKVSRNTPPSN